MKIIIKILIIAGIILLVAILIFTVLKLSEKQERERIEKLPELVKEEVKEKKCLEMKTEEEREKCEEDAWYHYAYQKGDLKLCLRFKDNINRRTECLLNNIVTFKLSVERCNVIADIGARDNCFRELAVKREETAICNNIEGELPREECEGITQAVIYEKEKNLKGCYEIEVSEYGNHCFRTIFNQEGLDFCEKLESGNEKEYCLSENLLTLAIQEKNPKKCEEIPWEKYKKVCLNITTSPLNIWEVDSDKDKVDDRNELAYRLDPFNPDSDGDGLTDGEELFTYFTEAEEKDTDHDGLTDYEEIKIYNTNPNKPDTDGDGILDGEEIKKGTDPVSGDKDRDGLSDELEARIGTDPNKKDTDNDGILDGDEWERGFDPLKYGSILADTDKDGLFDIDEIFYGTDRLNPDTDGDGISDKKEVDELTNPLGEGDMDFDNDGLTDKEEEKYGTNPSLADTDGDGISDFDEIKKGTDPLKKD
jgi:hypothetical protein